MAGGSAGLEHWLERADVGSREGYIAKYNRYSTLEARARARSAPAPSHDHLGDARRSCASAGYGIVHG
jgi:hypothetical protein